MSETFIDLFISDAHGLAHPRRVAARPARPGVLRTRAGVKPAYVSMGHQVGLGAALRYVLACTTRYRLPQTTRYAHRVAGGEEIALKTGRKVNVTVQMGVSLTAENAESAEKLKEKPCRVGQNIEKLPISAVSAPSAVKNTCPPERLQVNHRLHG